MNRMTLKRGTAWVAAASIVQPFWMLPAAAQQITEPALTLATTTTSPGAAQARDPSSFTPLTTAQKIKLLRQKVKYVFVLFQENRSFEHYFGTYPGANGLYSTYPGANPADPYAAPANTFSSFKSLIQNTDGSFSTISPFLIPRTIVNAAGTTIPLYPEDTYSVDHSHAGYQNDFHYDAATKSKPLNDGYVLDQQGLHFSGDGSSPGTVVNGSGVPPTSVPTLQSKQKGEVVISHIDCDTIPLLWQYADRFTLLDNMHQTATGPSTPNAIAMIAGQVGDTQWVKHPGNVNSKNTTSAYGPGNGSTGQALTLPNLTDSAPYPGSVNDTALIQPPYGPDESTNSGSQTGPFTSGTPQITLTFATQPLSFAGSNIGNIVKADQHIATDLVDVSHDIQAIAAKNPSIDWGWYQQGFGPEPFDGTNIYENSGSYHYTAAPQHASYIVHHNGPEYFGYLSDNPVLLAHQHGLQQFYTDVQNQALNPNGGVYYVRGGYYNNDGLTPIDPNVNVQRSTPGNDDHPNYSDAQISEALVADSVNAIVNSPYWPQSAIIITYDETDGLYDHQPEQFRTYGPDGLPETGGPRIPTIVISPFAAAHTVSHVYSEHSSVIKFINELYGLVPLADLPDELAARKAGATMAAFNGPNGPQTNLGPADDLVDPMGDLLEAFDNDRLLGNVAPLPASYAAIDPAAVHTLPHYGAVGACVSPNLLIVPTDYPNGYGAGLESDPPPLDFNPRPVQSPGNPYLNTNNNTGGTSTGPWPF